MYSRAVHREDANNSLDNKPALKENDIPRLKTMPRKSPDKNAFPLVLPSSAKKNGTRPIHARNQRSTGGNARTSIAPESIIRRISLSIFLKGVLLKRAG